MRRWNVIPLLLLLGAGTLAGCGQKGPLTLPPTKPAASQPAANAQPAPPGTAATPASQGSHG